MNIKGLSRIIFITLITCVLVLSCIGFSYATSTSELQNQANEIDQKIDQLNSEIAGKKSEMTTALNQINKLNSQISSYNNEIEDLETKITDLGTQINEKTTSIAEQEEKYDIQKELLDKRLIALYEAGETSYLQMLLDSNGLTDFLSRYYTIEILADADQELLTKITNTKEQLTKEKAELETAKQEVETSKTAVVGKKKQLSTSVSEKKTVVNTLSAEEAALQAELEEFEADKRAIQAELSRLAYGYTGEVVKAENSGYICPIPGKSKRNITTGYYGYVGHTGVDFACAGGTPIVAVKAGKVVTSKALVRANGTYKSYGEYVVIDHQDGTMTLYAHMQPNSRMVSEEQYVSQGQQIGRVGTTGNSTGNHLHFEVRVKGRCQNPTPYLP